MMSSLRSFLVVMNLASLRFGLPLMLTPTVRPGANFCEWKRGPSGATVFSSVPHVLVGASLLMRKTKLLSCLNCFN
uniref:Secreted protein n=1 Tax=Brassica oleracea var. oleracea TaxID=109376 RepID=A0A0D3A0L7_BRAOL